MDKSQALDQLIKLISDDLKDIAALLIERRLEKWRKEVRKIMEEPTSDH